MKLRTKAAMPKPDRETLEVLDQYGQVVGEVRPYEHDQWHAVISLPLGDDRYTLIQGFAQTPEDAIVQAIEKGLKYHSDALVKIKEVAAVN